MKEIIERFKCMFKIKSCKGFCVICEFYDWCKWEGADDES